MRHGHPSILVLLLTALLVGVSISGGPVVWALLVMVAPLVVMMMFTTRGVGHAGLGMSHAAVPLRPGEHAGSAEVIRAGRVHDRERIARAGAEEYTQAHLND